MMISSGLGRVSTLQFNQMNREQISRSTAALQTAGRELATGRRSDIFAELGSSATISLSLRAGLEETNAYIIGNQLLEGRLQAQLVSIDAIRGHVDTVLQAVLANSSSPTAGAETLQLQARTALDVVISQLNISFNGEALFAGTKSAGQPLTRYADVHPTTGLSPQTVITDIISGPPASLAQVNAISMELDNVFSSTSPDPDRNFEETFFSGTPALDSGGMPSRRVSARIEPGMDLNYGLQANDEPFREIIKGLAMLAAADVSEISQPEVYVAWMEHVSETLGNASSQALRLSAETGFRQQTLETTQQRLKALRIVQQAQIGGLENADPYEAATRMKSLETQLRATYEITAQLSSLSLLNYL